MSAAVSLAEWQGRRLRPGGPTKIIRHGGVALRGFMPEDLLAIGPLQPEMERRQAPIDGWRGMGPRLLQGGMVWTVEEAASGRVIACAGFLMPSPGPVPERHRATAYCFLSAQVPMQAWVPMHRLVMLKTLGLLCFGITHVDADIAPDNLPAVRWARMLGFEPTGQTVRLGPLAEEFDRYTADLKLAYGLEDLT